MVGEVDLKGKVVKGGGKIEPKEFFGAGGKASACE